MKPETYFLAWEDRDREKTRSWFPIGRLDVDVERSKYRFRYISGAVRAQNEAGFPLLFEFPELHAWYESSILFPVFRIRVMSPARRDYGEYVRQLGLDGLTNPIQMLTTSGGVRVTDTFEVFPKLERDENGDFCCRFLLRGWNELGELVQERIESLEPQEELILVPETALPGERLAIQIRTMDNQLIGKTPQFLAEDLAAAIKQSPQNYGASVVQVNLPPAPLSHRVLVEMRGQLGDHEPMSSDDFRAMAE